MREILETLRQTYCGKIGCEYMNIQHPEQKRWLQQRMEPEANNWPLDREVRLRILEDLIGAEQFEHFLHARFVGQKRFSLQGAETAIAILDELLDRAADRNVHEVVIGMAHRGRLTVLANVVGKPLAQIFSEFEGNVDPSSTQGSGDVKYHLGASGVRRSASGKEIVVSVAPNPSHLEAVDPVVEGIVRPKQDRLGDTERERVIPLLIHGDAAFAGQGVVAETLNLSQLDGYSTGGTIHLIINNQIGFHDAARTKRVRRLIPPTWRAWCRRRSSTSTATIPRRPSAWRRSPSITGRSSRRTSSSTCSATAGGATTKPTIPVTRSRCFTRRSRTIPRWRRSTVSG